MEKSKKITVWYMRPKGIHEKGYWFVTDFSSDVVNSIFETLNRDKNTSPRNIGNFFLYKEQKISGWWTSSEEKAKSAQEMLSLRGLSVIYKEGLPFERNYGADDTDQEYLKNEQFKRWEGDISVPLSGIVSLLQFPALNDRDRGLLNRWFKIINTRGWLNLAQIHNLRIVFRRKNNLNWLVKKGYTYVVKNAAFVEEPVKKAINVDLAHLWAKAPPCCREKMLLSTAKDLRKRGMLDDANKLEQFVKLASRIALKDSRDEPASKLIVGAPKALDRYYTSCMGTHKNKDQCTEVAWNIYCKHINANHATCHKRRGE